MLQYLLCAVLVMSIHLLYNSALHDVGSSVPYITHPLLPFSLLLTDRYRILMSADPEVSSIEAKMMEEEDHPAKDKWEFSLDEQGRKKIKMFNGQLIKTVIKAGSGARPVNGSKVSCHYVGTLLDGTKFDSSRDRGEPFEFTLGKRQVIRGWDAGIATMRPGEVAILTCVPEFAYGEMGSPPAIPPNATLNFEVELLSWTPGIEHLAGGIVKSIREEGQGWRTCSAGAVAEVKIVARVKDDTAEPFLETGDDPVKIHLDSPDLPEGIESALFTMKHGETSRFWIKGSTLADGLLPSRHKNGPITIDPEEVYVYDITLVSSILPKEAWELTFSEKLAEGAKIKDFGNALFAKGQYARAVKRYEEADRLFEFETDLKGDEKKAAEALRSTCLLNMAMCKIKNKEYRDAVSKSEEAIKYNPFSVKAYYRLAESQTLLNQLDEAKQTIDRALQLPDVVQNPALPGVADIKKLQTVVQQRIKAMEDKERSVRTTFQVAFVIKVLLCMALVVAQYSGSCSCSCL